MPLRSLATISFSSCAALVLCALLACAGIAQAAPWADCLRASTGMCFSNEPMICIPGEFGIRHEDHFYMTERGPKWFTQPAHTIDDPFGLAK